MAVVLNIVVVAFTLLIAYWWANQGFLSAMLHFVCVVAAGAVALAVWEPITVKLLLTGGEFDRFAWAVSLLGVFVLTLLALRVAADKIVPDNLNLPVWANYGFGGLFGLGAAILTVGIVLIGGGFAQSSVELMGFIGEARDSRGQPRRVQSLWVPVHRMTAEFYSFTSAGSLAPTFTRSSLRRHYPNLDGMGLALFRDSADDGKGLVAIKPGAVQVEAVGFAPTLPPGLTVGDLSGAVLVRVRFDQESYDLGERLRLTSSQARLIGRAPAGRFSQPPVAHPLLWMAANPNFDPSDPMSIVGLHRFDDLSHIASGIPGQQSTVITLVFPAAPFGGTPPEFIQIKGVRFRLPTPQTGPESVATMVAGMAQAALTAAPEGGSRGSGPGVGAAGGAAAPPTVTEPLAVRNSLSRLTLSLNQLSGLRETSNYVTEGRQEFRYDTGARMPGMELRVRGIHEPEGTRVLQLDVSRRISPIDIFGDSNPARIELGDDAQLVLVDSLGRRYTPFGYIWERPDNVEVMLDPRRGIRRVGDLPQLPTAATHRLFVVFRITEGVTIVDVQLGSTSLGRVNVVADGPRR